MTKSRLLGALFVGVAFIAIRATAADAPAAAPSGPPGAAAFGALPAIEHMAMSPNGAKLAYIAAQGDVRAIVIENADGSHPTIAPIKDKPRGVEWASNDVVLVSVSVTSDEQKQLIQAAEFFRVIAIDLTTRKERILKAGYDGDLNGAIAVAAETYDAQGHVMIPAWEYEDTAASTTTGSRLNSDDPISDSILNEVFEVDPKTGDRRVVAKGAKNTTSFAYGSSGEVIARTDFNPKTGTLLILAVKGSTWRKALQIDNMDTEKVGFIGVEPGNATLLLLDSRGEKPVIQRLDLATGALTTALDSANRPPIDGVLTDRYTGALVAVYEAGDAHKWRWIDPLIADLENKLSGAFPGKAVTVDDWTNDRKKFLFTVTGASVPTTYYIIDLTTMHADIVGEQYPQLANVTLGEKTSITYPARDGTKIPAYLTLPPGKTGKNLPLVILPHGGPAGSDDPSFDYWAQDLATHGYAVLQPQFRGSTGYGAAWEQAGWRQWGGLMQDDLTDGVKYLISTGQVDPKRVCIAGASYGGYAALAGATMTPDLYACAVSISGPSNLPELRGYVQGPDSRPSESMNYESHNIGDKFDPKVKAASPVYLAKNVKAPILIIQGSDDTVVPFSQADEMVKALRADGKSVTFVQLQGEDHWWSRAATRQQIMQATDDFLAKYLGS